MNKTKSIDEQINEAEQDVRDHDWRITERYSDGVSASRYSKRARKGWDSVLADIDAQRIDVLVLWESSRGDRRLADWAAMLDLCRDHGVRIWVVTHGRLYDMANSRDWKTMAEEGVASADESNKTSDRQRRAMAAQARAGRPQGKVRYGFERVYDPHSPKRELIEQRAHGEQAPIVAELYRRTLDLEPLKMIVDDFNSRGIPSPAGGTWTRQTARGILTNIDYSGRRELRGEIYPAIWPAIVPEADWLAVQRILGDPKRIQTRPASQRWLMSYLALCVCETGFCASPAKPGRARALYRCPDKGCTSILAHMDPPPSELLMNGLDGFVSEQVVMFVATRLQLRPPSNDAAALAARTEVEILRARLEEWRISAAHGETSPASLAQIEAQIKADMVKAQRREMEASAPRVLLDLVDGAGGDLPVIHERWDSMPIPARREIISTLVTVHVEPATRRGTRLNPFDPNRVVLDWTARFGQ